MSDDGCRVCHKWLRLDDGCEWPEAGPVCWECLQKELDRLRAENDGYRAALARGLDYAFRLFDALRIDKAALDARDVDDLVLERVNGLVVENASLRAPSDFRRAML